MSQRILTTADEVFGALGGIPGVMEITGDKYKTVHQWKSSGSFPSNSYVLMTAELKRRGYSAAPSLWHMRAAEATA